jgi:hypothetical protein
MTAELPEIKLSSVEIEDLDPRDYPDFCDAFISYAESVDGVALTEEQLEILNEDSEFVHSLAWVAMH